MRKRILAIVAALIMVMTMIPATVMAETPTPTADPDWYGDGTATEYEINDAGDLLAFAQAVNVAGDNFSGKKITLNADIDLKWMEWAPISFSGTFEGNGHTISNITYIPNDSGRMGFFQTLSGPAENLTLDGIKGTVPANGRFGGFARYLNAPVKNVHVKNIEVTTTDSLAWVGGITTYTAGGSTTDCSVENMNVNAAAGADLIGGVTALTSNRQLYENTDVKGFNVTISDTDSSGCGVGGFAGQTQTGWNNPKMKDCDITGIDIKASGLVDVGGFIAWPGAHTEYADNCTTEGKIDATGITGENNFVGGFFGNLGWNCDLGYMGHVVTNCTADVDIISGGAPAGGFVGSATNSNDRSMYATFTNCTAKGDVTNVNGPAGGFAGEADRGVYTNCTAEGKVNGATYAGGFIGHVIDVTPKYDNRYPAGTRGEGPEKMDFDNCVGSPGVTGPADKTAIFIGVVDPDTDVDIINPVDPDDYVIIENEDGTWTIELDVPPTADVTYSTNEKTTEPITVTITASEPVTAPEGWTEEEGAEGHVWTKVFAKNTTETVKLVDRTGNEVEVTVEITNITDKAAGEAAGNGNAVPPTGQTETQTGDNFNAGVYGGAAILALMTMVAAVFVRRRSHK